MLNCNRKHTGRMYRPTGRLHPHDEILSKRLKGADLYLTSQFDLTFDLLCVYNQRVLDRYYRMVDRAYCQAVVRDKFTRKKSRRMRARTYVQKAL